MPNKYGKEFEASFRRDPQTWAPRMRKVMESKQNDVGFALARQVGAALVIGATTRSPGAFLGGNAPGLISTNNAAGKAREAEDTVRRIEGYIQDRSLRPAINR